jgi:hypothetical protein
MGEPGQVERVAVVDIALNGFRESAEFIHFFLFLDRSRIFFTERKRPCGWGGGPGGELHHRNAPRMAHATPPQKYMKVGCPATSEKINRNTSTTPTIKKKVPKRFLASMVRDEAGAQAFFTSVWICSCM